MFSTSMAGIKVNEQSIYKFGFKVLNIMLIGNMGLKVMKMHCSGNTQVVNNARTITKSSSESSEGLGLIFLKMLNGLKAGLKQGMDGPLLTLLASSSY